MQGIKSGVLESVHYLLAISSDLIETQGILAYYF